MKILVLGNSAWDDKNSLGNTLTNWFENFGDDEFAFIYNREEMPCNRVCRHYFQVTVRDILHNILSQRKIGKEINSPKYLEAPNNNIEAKAIVTLKGIAKEIVKMVIELLYSSRIWMNDKIYRFISDFNPDIVFSFTIADGFRYNLIKYAKFNTNAKIVEFVADDVYGRSVSTFSLMQMIYRYRIPKLLNWADKVYGASVPMCDAYQSIFKIPLSPLYKGVEISRCRSIINEPLKIVYAGNLFFGRGDVLGEIADAVSEINSESKRIELDIFSNSYVSQTVENRINRPDIGCTLHNARPYDEIKQILSQSDIILHVESFQEPYKSIVRYSFSTKIIDCLQSGSTMLAIGPNDNASIKYLKTIPGVMVCEDLDLVPTLKEITNGKVNLVECAQKINIFAKKNHDVNSVRSSLRSDFQSLLQ